MILLIFLSVRVPSSHDHEVNGNIHGNEIEFDTLLDVQRSQKSFAHTDQKTCECEHVVDPTWGWLAPSSAN